MKKLAAFLFFFCIAYASLSQQAMYATLGTGNLRNQICWFNWAGINIANGTNATFTTDDGMLVTISLSGVTGTTNPHVMNCWGGSILWNLYDFANPAVMPALYTGLNTIATSNFTMTISATRGGIATPFILVAADAEASANTETTTLQTNGSAWRTIEVIQNAPWPGINPVTGCNTNTVQISNTYGGNPNSGQNPIVATDASTGNLVVSTTLARTAVGGMGIAFGIFSPIDRGDLPVVYGVAHHSIPYSTQNACSYPAPLPVTTQLTNLGLGNFVADADATQTTDDNLVGSPDEDAISTFPFYNGSGSYTLNVPINNSKGTAYLSAWFDFNRDQIFSAAERVTYTVPIGTTSIPVTWSGLPSIFTPGSVSDFAFRFRLSTSQADVQAATGFAPDGEVEDYLVSADTLAPPVCPEECDWTLTGNTTASYNFIGTKNNQPFNIRTNNLQRVTVTPSGTVGINTSAPTAQFHTVGSVRHENLRLGNYNIVTIDNDGNLYRSPCVYNCRFEPIFEERITALENEIKELKKLNSLSNVEKNKIILEQNQPNPFGETTVFKYSIPSEIRSASLTIYNLEGKQIKSYPITSFGKSSIQVTESSLSAGIYLAMILGANGTTSETIKFVIAR